MKRLIPAFLSLTAFLTHAEVATIGQTYKIAEPDVYEEIMERARKVDWKKALSKNQDDWGVFRGVPVSISMENKTFYRIPWYSSEFEIKDPRNGRLLYPKGYTFNPLVYTPRMPFRLIFVDPSQVWFVQQHKQPNDMVIFTHGNVLKIRKKLGYDVFLLDKKTKERIPFDAVPSIVSQVGQQFKIDQYKGVNDEIQ